MAIYDGGLARDDVGPHRGLLTDAATAALCLLVEQVGVATGAGELELIANDSI
jgi:hypothetical protein